MSSKKTKKKEKKKEEEKSAVEQTFANAVNDLDEMISSLRGEELTTAMLFKLQRLLIRTLYWTERLRAERYFKQREEG
jgi:hypothetical protein